jgi:light-regulated signal transduction histidine kinase (bacteriophytochrome)
MTGYTPGEHYADPDLGLKRVHPEDRHLLERSMRSPEEPLVLRWYRKDGGLIWTEQRNRPIYDEAGSLIAMEGIARDITERKLAEEALWLNEEQSETTRGPEGQRVTLESASSSGELRIDVGDQGPGIPETELPHVFDRFYRLATVEKPGSGLSIAQTIAEAHGGRIEAESQPGVGTRMSFILPLLQEESNVS